jgi:hypothetical protein
MAIAASSRNAVVNAGVPVPSPILRNTVATATDSPVASF